MLLVVLALLLLNRGNFQFRLFTVLSRLQSWNQNSPLYNTATKFPHIKHVFAYFAYSIFSIYCPFNILPFQCGTFCFNRKKVFLEKKWQTCNIRLISLQSQQVQDVSFKSLQQGFVTKLVYCWSAVECTAKCFLTFVLNNSWRRIEL